jgi:hypothetical protein
VVVVRERALEQWMSGARGTRQRRLRIVGRKEVH